MDQLVSIKPKKSIEDYFDKDKGFYVIPHDDAESFIVYYIFAGVACSNGNQWSSMRGVILDLESEKLDYLDDYKKILDKLVNSEVKVYPIIGNDYKREELSFRRSNGVFEEIQAMELIFDYVETLSNAIKNSKNIVLN